MRPLEYIIKFRTKLLFKLPLGDFRMFLRLSSLFTMFAHQKPPENCHRSLKDVCLKLNLLLLFKIHVKAFDKIVFYVTCCKLRDMFCFIKFCNSRISWFEYWTVENVPSILSPQYMHKSYTITRRIKYCISSKRLVSSKHRIINTQIRKCVTL